MPRKNSGDPVALLETASTSAPPPPPPVQYPSAILALITNNGELARIARAIPATAEFVEPLRMEFEDRVLEADLGDQKQTAGLCILSTQIAVADARVALLRREYEAKIEFARRLNVQAFREIEIAAFRRAHYQLAKAVEDGTARDDHRSRDEVIQSRTGDRIRMNLSSVRSLTPAGGNPEMDGTRLAKAAADVFGELNELQHELGDLPPVDPATDWLANRDPAQTGRTAQY